LVTLAKVIAVVKTQLPVFYLHFDYINIWLPMVEQYLGFLENNYEQNICSFDRKNLSIGHLQNQRKLKMFFTDNNH
jgi:hypothetical protein